MWVQILILPTLQPARGGDGAAGRVAMSMAAQVDILALPVQLCGLGLVTSLL